jgi:hypothetical protein
MTRTGAIRSSALRTVMAAMAVLIAGCGASSESGPTPAEPTSTVDAGTVPTSTAMPITSSGAMEPGTYVFRTFDPDFDASYRITMDIPDGFQGFEGFAVRKLGAPSQTGMSAWVVGNVYADPCHWIGTLLDPPVGSSVDGLVAALASQKGRHASTPTDVTVDGFAGKYMELIGPARINLADCHGGEFRTWLDTSLEGVRYLEPGQRDLLWIVDVDGTPLVIDAALGAGTSAQDRAGLIQIMESVRIDPL